MYVEKFLIDIIGAISFEISEARGTYSGIASDIQGDEFPVIGGGCRRAVGGQDSSRKL